MKAKEIRKTATEATGWGGDGTAKGSMLPEEVVFQLPRGNQGGAWR